MVARISTNLFYHTGLNAMEQHSSDLLKIQEQLSTGKRINRPSDDPVAVAKLHNLNKSLATIDRFVENGRYAKSQLELEDVVLNDATANLQRARELTIQMMNDSYNASDRQATAAEIDQIIKQMLSLTNTRNPEKELLFAGFSSDATAVFEDTNNDGFYEYQGDVAGQRFVQIGFDNDSYVAPNDEGDPSRVRIGDRGTQAFSVTGAEGGNINILRPDGTTVAVENNVLNVLVNLRDWLQAGEQPPAEIGEQLYQSINNISQVQAQLGGRINRIDSQYEALQTFQLTLKEHKMNLEEVDVVKATADFTQTQTALQFAQQAFARVQQISLFNYLR